MRLFSRDETLIITTNQQKDDVVTTHPFAFEESRGCCLHQTISQFSCSSIFKTFMLNACSTRFLGRAYISAVPTHSLFLALWLIPASGSIVMSRPKRKASNIAQPASATSDASILDIRPPPAKRRSKAPQSQPIKPEPGINGVIEGQAALRASPDAHGPDEKFQIKEPAPRVARIKEEVESIPSLIDDASSLSELSENEPSLPPGKGKAVKPSAPVNIAKQESSIADPEAEADEEADEEEIKEALSRPPPVNSDYLPLPWKGRLGYACLNTYLRYSNPPVFSSRTCRIASILEHRHPLENQAEPEHATKNRPDKTQPADIARGQAYVENLGLSNARDIVKMLRWNDKYGIKFLRLSSEMFPFASHEEYGYKLAPFASEVLAEAGKLAAELGHRLTTHPGQVSLICSLSSMRLRS